jgi:hypothetical protein
LPLESTVPVPRIVPRAFLTINILPISPVPVRVGVVSLVRELLAGAVIPGAIGAVVSTVNTVVTGDPTFPAASVSITI